MEATLSKIASLVQNNPGFRTDLGQIKSRKQLLSALHQESKKQGLPLSGKQIGHVLHAGADHHYTDIPAQKVLGPACFNTSSDDDEENGGTSCMTSC